MMLSCNLARWQNAPTTNMSAYRHRFNTISIPLAQVPKQQREDDGLATAKRKLFSQRCTCLSLSRKPSCSSWVLRDFQHPAAHFKAWNYPHSETLRCRFTQPLWLVATTPGKPKQLDLREKWWHLNAFDLINNMQSCTSLYIICM